MHAATHAPRYACVHVNILPSTLIVQIVSQIGQSLLVKGRCVMYYGSMRACMLLRMYGGPHAWLYACTHARMCSRHNRIAEGWLLNLLVEEIFL